MAFTGTITTEAEIALMAGENVDATGDTEANRNDLIAQAESYLSNLMKFNIVDNYASLNEDVRRMFSEWGARYAAIALISFNMVGYTSRIEAEDMINIHIYRMEKIEGILNEVAHIDFIRAE